MENLIDEKEASKILSLTMSCLRNWRYKKKGPPYYKIGRRVKYDRNELYAWLKNKKIKAEGDNNVNNR